MSDSISNCVPYDATGQAVNLDTEYMYRDDGLKLKVIRFEYYECDDADYNWFILAQIECSNVVKAHRYKVVDLYLDYPINKEVQQSVNDVYTLKDKLSKLMFQLTSAQDIYDILCNYAYDNLGVEKGKYVGATDKQVLIQILTRFRWDLYDIAEKLENHDVE